MIELMHFLRPLWLVAVPAIALTWFLVRRHESRGTKVTTLIAPHLRDALTVNSDARRGVRAVDGVALALVIVAFAAAGPTWSKQPSPWFAETATLVVAVEVSDSMRANDLSPTRLDRARFKILDLIAARTGSRTALIAYAGSAHIVVPPSKDPGVLKTFLESLDPAIMPEGRTNAANVLPLARSLVVGDGGTLLFVNDGFDSADLPALTGFSEAPEAPAMVALVVGRDEGGVALLPDGSPAVSPSGARIDTAIDPAILDRVSRQSGMTIIRNSAGDADIRRLLRSVESALSRAEDPDSRWQDQGWWFLWPALFLSLGWFRRGWTMQW